MSAEAIIMPCLDMRDGRVVKGVQFVDIVDAGDPVECARAYCLAGADELALLDITATVENRATMLEVVKRVAEVCTVPLTVGGGISSVKIAGQVLAAGAAKISVSSAAFRQPELILQLLEAFGSAAVTLALDVEMNPRLPSGYEIYLDGGRTPTGYDAVEWAKKINAYGVTTILPTSKTADGAKTGYDLKIIAALAASCQAKIVASGGAGQKEHFLAAVRAGAQILLAASVFHYHLIDIGELKQYLKQNGVITR